jgi:hypothetical protein
MAKADIQARFPAALQWKRRMVDSKWSRTAMDIDAFGNEVQQDLPRSDYARQMCDLDSIGQMMRQGTLSLDLCTIIYRAPETTVIVTRRNLERCCLKSLTRRRT